MAKFNDTNFDDSKLKRGSILYSSKISPVVEGEYALFNAYNMSWEGYKFGDSNEITYTGQVIAEIDKKATTTSLENLEDTVKSLKNDVNSLQTKSADYYEQRWRTAGKEETVNAPEKTDLTVDVDDVNWHLTPQYESGKHTWMTSRKVVYVLNDTAYFKQYYDEPWSTPMKMTGNDGSVAYPVHQVLLYKWTDSREDVPTIVTTSSTKPDGWQESPGNATPNTYLWMIQGQRQNSNYIKWDADGDSVTEMTYWSSPICLSGSDGKPGKDGKDVEFIYKRFTSEQSFADNNNPANWNADQNDNYLGPAGYTWNNNPEGVSSSYPYEYSSIRYKKDGVWGTFIPPFLWSKFGEDGLDGDGVEYIYCACNYDNQNDLNNHYSVPAFNLNTTGSDAFQKPEVYDGTIWHDDPQEVNNTTQKYQWVSTRKYKKITDSNKGEISESFTDNSYTMDNVTVSVGTKIWFPYSEPALWNWYVNDGTNADRIVMLYQRNSSINNSPDIPSNDSNNQYTISKYSYLGWAETPGNKTDDSSYAYLWMTSNYYSEKTTSGNDTIYTLSGDWTIPVCLTGESGQEGVDGADIEFIYYRTADDNKTFGNDWNNFDGDSTENGWPFNTSSANIIDEIQYYDPNGVFDEATSSDELHDVWTDNPLGVTSTYDYEYASVRRKHAGSNSKWGDFCKPFLWAKYGEDGVDGDGVEYIFYRTDGTTAAEFTGTGKNPKTWLHNEGYQTTSEYKKPKPSNETTWWNDDPLGVGTDNKYEYVSTRKKISKQNYFELVKNWLNPLGKSFTSEYNDWINNYYNAGEYNSSAYSNWKKELIDNNASWTNEDELNAIYNLLTNKQQKVWGPYSEPALWSNFAEDAVASNLTIETDNDVMAVAIDGQNTTRNASSNSAQVFLYHNLSLLSSDKYNVSIVSSNCEQSWLTILNTDNKWLVTINIPANVSLPQDGSFNFQIMATVSTDTSIPEEIRGAERLYTFKVIGLSLSTIYQLKTDKLVIHRDSHNNLENVNVTMFNISDINDTFTTGDSLPENFYIFAKPIYTSKGDSSVNIAPTYDNQKYGDKLFLKDNDSFTIDQYKSEDTTRMILTSVEFNLVYTSDAVDKQSIIDSFSQQYIVENIFILINNGVLVDRETVSVISDGANGNPGVDSKSQEYIYFLCDEFGKTFTGDENPATWISNKPNYQTDDYPFIGTDGANILNNGWTDHPQGISETQRYEYISTRTYDTSTKTWGAFSEPVIWANWGHSGEDGDGVEYIYYLYDNEYVDVNKYPLFWSNDVNFDSSEYIKENSNWTDKPSGTSSVQKYEYVSVRKYKRIKNNSDILHLLFDDFLLSTLSNEYDNFLNNTDWDVQPGPNITLLDYIFNICENYCDNISSISSDTLENPQSDWYDKQTIGNDFDLYGFIYEALSKYFNYEERQATYNQGSETCTYFKLIENNDKFWTPYSEPTLWAKYGEKGDNGEDAYVLDWTNDQINLAVDENGKIKPNQTKSTTLTTNSDNIKISSVNATLPSSFTYTGNVIDGKYDIKFTFDSNYNDNYQIPESGIEVTFTVTLTNNKTLTKVLKICGQHIPSDGIDGQNAVTYEILTSVNSATRNTTNVISPSAVTLSALKYSGIDITTLTALPEYLKFTYVFGNDSNISKEYNVDNTYTFNLISTAYADDFKAEVKPGSPSVGTGNESSSSEELGNSAISNGATAVNAEQSGVQETSLTPGVEIGGGIGGGIDGPSVVPDKASFKVSYTNVYLSYLYNNVWKHIDVETIPIIDHGEKGAQGFTGPVVRMRGEFKERDTGGYYSDGSAQKNYDESTDGIRYKDIVWYNNQYWTPNPEKCNGHSADGAPASYVTRHTGVIACYDSDYWPGGKASYWVPATQFDFVATKLLYADQALINQISTHDLIATNQNGYPVAGVTSGSKMYDKNNTEITSYLSTLGTVQYSENAENDSANVRIFAGEIWNGTSYSLTYAPFNVRQDGTAYMSKANIIGDVNIGGNVDISGTNVKVAGDISAKSLALSRNNTFFYNTPTILPSFNENENRVIYAMYYNSSSDNRVIIPIESYLWMATTNGIDRTDNAGDNYIVDDKALYTFYSGYGNHPTRETGNCKYWIMTKSELVIKPEQSVETIVIPPSITYNLSAEQLSQISISRIEIEKTSSSGHSWNTQIAKISLEGFINASIPDSITRAFGTETTQNHTFTNTKEIYVGITIPDSVKEISRVEGFTEQELSVELINSSTKYDGDSAPIIGSNYITIGTTDEVDSGAAGNFYFQYNDYNAIDNIDELKTELKHDLKINYISIIYTS